MVSGNWDPLCANKGSFLSQLKISFCRKYAFFLNYRFTWAENVGSHLRIVRGPQQIMENVIVKESCPISIKD
jgi:hypothetical protein